MQLAIGETVLYTLSEDDVREINDPLDVTFSGGPGRRNPVLPGQTYPACGRGRPEWRRDGGVALAEGHPAARHPEAPTTAA